MFTSDFTPVKGLCGVFTDKVSKLINATEKSTKKQQPVSSKNKQTKKAVKISTHLDAGGVLCP